MNVEHHAEPQPILEVDSLCKSFGTSRGLFYRPREIHAVNGISLTIAKGETLGIVGESGCGKSTLSRMLAGVIEPTSGSFRFNGQDLSGLPLNKRQDAMKAIQMVFQSPFSSLNPRMRAIETVREPLDVHRSDLPKAERETRAMATLADVGISPELARRFPHQLSGGQQQRVGIARAIVGEVSLVICDEPVSALDVSVQAQVINLLRGLQDAQGVAYLFVSHDLAVVGAMSDRIAVMYLGRIIEIGDAAELLAHPRHPYTQCLIDSANLPDPDIERTRQPRILQGELPRPTDPDVGCRFASRCWKTTELCRTHRPELHADEAGRRAVACHYAL